MSKIGDAPIDPARSAEMKALAPVLDEYFNGENARTPNAKIGFVLMVFNRGEYGGRCNYISNTSPGDVEKLMVDQIVRFAERRAEK